jgi:hypothetical protein
MAGIDKFAVIIVAVEDQFEALRRFPLAIGKNPKDFHYTRPSTDRLKAELQTQAVFEDLNGNSYALLEPGGEYA